MAGGVHNGMLDFRLAIAQSGVFAGHILLFFKGSCCAWSGTVS